VPFIDFNHGLAVGGPSAYDYVIVGAGAAGILLAVKLSEKSKRVLLLESGHYAPDDERQSLNEVEQSGKSFGNPVWSRKRIIGGTTTAWGGQSLPFSPLDFEARDWVVNSGWPIPYSEVERHYAPANKFMGVDDRNYDTDLFPLLRRPDPGFDSARLRYHFSKWAREPNFLKLHRRRLEESVTVLYNAQLLRIDLGESGRVVTIEVANFRGRRVTMPVTSLVLAPGGIEANRLLLVNDHQVRGGLGNHSGWLGKAFMEHPCLEVGYVESNDMRRLQQVFAPRMQCGRTYSVRISIGEIWQRDARLLNASASILCQYPGQVDPVSEVKQFLRRPRFGTAVKVLRRSRVASRSVWALATEGFIYKPGSVASLLFMTEQEPTSRSYIGLGTRTDRFGMRLARLNWHITENTWHTVVEFAHAINEELRRLQLGRVDLKSHIRVDTPDWADYLSDVNHHMGGTRMSATADRGVVGPDLQVWGVPNLYVCSCSVFPTGSHSNPTLTLLALSSRLADRLAPC
jgi:choline dehydrogenase-like flavoprotein